VEAESWGGPPVDVLGCVVGARGIVGRGRLGVVALEHVVAFSEGCVLTLLLAFRGARDAAVWEAEFGGHDARFGVRFPDGRRATTVGHSFVGWARSTDRPEAPMLVEVGAESSSDRYDYRCRQQLWLWPLPPAADFELVVAWPAAGLDETAMIVDGRAVVEASARAQPFWE